MRVTSDRQTLILAGETPPRRSGISIAGLAGDVDARGADEADSSGDSSGGQRVTIISARVDAVVTQGSVGLFPAAARNTQPLAHTSYSSPPPVPANFYQAYVVANRASTSKGADAYARTRDLSDRTPLIDTYA